MIYYQLEENKTPLGKTVYQSKVRSRIQLAGDKVGMAHNEQAMVHPLCSASADCIVDPAPGVNHGWRTGPTDKIAS